MAWPDRLAQFKRGAFQEVRGPVSPGILDTLEVIQELQDARAIVGNIIEIGVLHGRFFLALDCLKRQDEVTVAVDIFDQKRLNIDGSGVDSTSVMFQRNIEKFAQSIDDIRILEADSLSLDESVLRLVGKNRGFRLFSVDGGHTPEHVLSDLRLAAETIGPGGVVLLDDYYNPQWPGVHEGFMKYMLFASRKLVPFGFHANKLLLTSPSYHRIYYEYYLQRMSSFAQYRTTRVIMCGFAAITVQPHALLTKW